MYISKVEFDPKKLAVEIEKRARSGQRINGSYEAHQYLWWLFDNRPDQERDFLYRRMKPPRDSNRNAPHFLVVSEREPEDRPYLRRLVVKPYAPQLACGERLLFSLRCNPVITRQNAITRRHHQVDMVQDARLRLKREGVPEAEMPRRTELAQNVAPEWLARHDFGLDVDTASIQVEAYDQLRFDHPKGGKITLARLDLLGAGTVRDPEALRHALYKGVGRARGFGFGLLLVRRLNAT